MTKIYYLDNFDAPQQGARKCQKDHEDGGDGDEDSTQIRSLTTKAFIYDIDIATFCP